MTRRFRVISAMTTAALAAATPGVALAHSPGQTAAWPPRIYLDELPIIVPLVLVAWVYLRGWNHTRRSWRGIAFLSANLALVLALLSPLDGLSESSFAAHMTQHMLLVDVAAPLLLLSRPLPELLRGLDRSFRRGAIRLLRVAAKYPLARLAQPVAAWFIFMVVFWTWHAPALYEAAIRNPVLHATEHVALTGAALTFWWPLLGWLRHTLDAPAALLYLFGASLQGTALGGLMVFAAAPWYSQTGANPFGLSPIADQQLAGLVMWLVSTVVFMAIGGWMFIRWMAEPRPVTAPESQPGHGYTIRYLEERR